MNSMNPRPEQGRFTASPPPKPQYPPGSLPAAHGKGDWAPFAFWQVTIFAVIMAIFNRVPVSHYLYHFANDYIALRQSTVTAQDVPDEPEEEERILDEDANIIDRESTILEDVIKECSFGERNTTLSFDFKEKTLVFNQHIVSGEPMKTYSCVVNKTNTPDGILIDMLNVDTHTALRSATWDGIQVFWRYYECSENADDIDLQVVYKYAE